MKSKKKSNSKHRPSVKQKLLNAFKVAVYVCLWCFMWSVVAVILAALLLSAVVAMMAPAEMTARGANNLVLAIILTIAAIFFAVVWLLRRSKVLFIRTSRAVLFVCTCLGLFIGVPISIAGVWQPENTSQNQVEQIKEANKKTKRWQYMYCSNGSYRYYTDEQFKNPQTGFTKNSKDYCASNGQGKMTKLADKPPQVSGNATSSTGSSYTEKQKKDDECSPMWYRYYESPKSRLETKLGGKPSSAHIIHYIGTDEYESVVAKYNSKAREWNASLKRYEQNFKTATLGMGCDMRHLFSGYDFDKVNEYGN